MTGRAALAFIRKHGVVLESARGEVPCLAERIAGGRMRGSWWAHPRSHEIFALTRYVRESDEVLVCRLVRGRITFVHRRLWPALVRLANRLPTDSLAKVREIHTASGRHRTELVPFPGWVPSGVREAAGHMSEEAALAQLGGGVSPRGADQQPVERAGPRGAPSERRRSKSAPAAR